jgi:hypothetical protein
MKKRFYVMIAVVFAVTQFLFIGCGYQINYVLNDEKILHAAKATPLKVRVAQMKDAREDIEKEASGRKNSGYEDFTDYTYDKGFRGNVPGDITSMLVNHLNYSGVFNPPAMVSSIHSGDISDAALDSLGQSGFDALLVGEIRNFYGYYDQNIGRQMLYEIPLAVASGLLLNWSTTSGNYQVNYYWYGPGLVLGAYLESLHKRKIEQHIRLNVKLISTTTHQPAWEDNFEIYQSGKRAMPGLNTANRKFELAVFSLRDAVNDMVKSISDNSENIMQNISQSVPYENISVKEHQAPEPVKENAEQPAAIQPKKRDQSMIPGIMAGMNISSFGGGTESAKSKIGLMLGGFLSIPMNERVSLRPEILYSMKGAKYKDSSFGMDYSATVSLNYLDIPVLCVVSIQDNFNLYAGPSLGFYLNGRNEYKLSGFSWDFDFDDSGSSTIESDEINSPELGAIFGGSMSVGGLDIGARYYLGMTEYAKTMDPGMKNRAFQLYLGYQFKK